MPKSLLDCILCSYSLNDEHGVGKKFERIFIPLEYMRTNWTAEAGYTLEPMKIEAADHQVDLPRCYPLRLGGLSDLELHLPRETRWMV